MQSKVSTRICGSSIPYVLCLDAARSAGLDLPGLFPGNKLTRGEMARLAVNFLAYDEGELILLRAAQEGMVVTGQDLDGDDEDADGCAPIICNDDRSFPSCESEGEIIVYDEHPCAVQDDEQQEEQQEEESVRYDPDSNVSTRSNFLLLGTVSPVLASVKIFNDTEPFDVTKITVVLTSAASSVEAFSVYDHDAMYLGRASLDSSLNDRSYVMNIKHGTLVVPKREDVSIYVRAIVKGHKSGGVSGETAEVGSIQIEGDGVWSNRSYLKGTSNSFNAFQTARSRVTSISNAGDEADVLISGTDIPLASFRFEGVTGDGSSTLQVTDLEFQIEQNGGVTISNVILSANSTTDEMSCTVAGTTVTCASISAALGTFEDEPRTLTLYGDVTVPDAKNSSLRLTLNQPGSVASAGAVTWTDGTTSFQWVQFSSLVARGTYFTR